MKIELGEYVVGQYNFLPNRKVGGFLSLSLFYKNDLPIYGQNWGLHGEASFGYTVINIDLFSICILV